MSSLSRLLLRSLVVWLVLAPLIWLDQALAFPAGDVHAAFIGAVIAAVGAAFAWLADKAVTIAVTVAQVAVMIGQAIASFAVLVANVFVKVWGFFGSFWVNVLKPFVSWAWKEITRLASWLQRTLRPVLDFLADVRRELLRFYDRWFRPIIDTLDVARRILGILATFRLEFARELDAQLAALEGRLLQPITFALRKLNEAMDVVNRIVTLNGLLQRKVLLESLWRDAELAWKALAGVEGKPLDGDAAALSSAPQAFVPPRESAAEFRAFLRTRQSRYSGLLLEESADLWASLRAGPVRN